jgi:hypothetical protein
MHVILVLETLRQEDGKFKASLGYIVRPSQNNNKKKDELFFFFGPTRV